MSFEKEVGFFFRLMMMAVRQRQRASIGIKFDLGKVTTGAPEVGEYTRVGQDMSTIVCFISLPAHQRGR